MSTPAPGPIRLVLVDDHEMVIAGLSAMLASYRGRVRVVGRRSAPRAVGVVEALAPTSCCATSACRASAAWTCAGRCASATRACRVVLLSVYDDEQYLFQALRAGAAGYLLKQISGDELVRQLELAHTGVTVIDTVLAGRAVDTAARLQSDEYWPGARQGLTQRESEVLSLMVTGLSNRGDRGRLVVSDETMKSHLRSIYRKLGVATGRGGRPALREGTFP